MIVFVWIFAMFLVDKSYRTVKINTVKANAKSIVENINNDNLGLLLDRIAYESDTCLMIVGEDGTVVYDVGEGQRVCLIHHLSSDGIAEKISLAKIKGSGYLETTVLSEILDEDYSPGDFAGTAPSKEADVLESLLYVELTRAGDGKEYAVILNTVITPVTAVTGTAAFQAVLLTAGILVLSMIVAFAMSKLIASPIESLNRTAKRIAGGKWDVDFQCSGYTEIEELKDTLNYAAGELKELDRYRKELLANVSHDLRTPLTLIKAYSEMMRDIPSENTPENLQTVIDETERLSNLVEDMLNVSNIQSGGRDFKIERFDLAATIGTLLDRHGRLLSGMGYEVRYENKTPLPVMADEQKIVQVVYNLVNNAVNYAGADNLVIVRAFVRDNRFARVEVEDHGAGIDVNILPHIWDRYYKSNKVHRRASVGTGLGLSIVKSVMSAMPGGVYGVDSDEGKGSIFYIELPLSR